jgi:hypothetical protein
MFHRTKKGPAKPFFHRDDCKVLLADPGVEIPWSEVERGQFCAVRLSTMGYPGAGVHS